MKTSNFFLIAGNCVVEDETTVHYTAAKIKEITDKYNIDFIFKASWKKANRSSIDSFTGIEPAKALKILSDVKKKHEVRILTDIHEVKDIDLMEDIDIIQIPAFLCRQTELLVAAGETGKTLNIKKGQFMSPSAMKYVAEKVESTGNNDILLTERGTMFGYNDLILDLRSILIMKRLGYPVVVDITHSLQKPNQQVTGGSPEYIEAYGKAALAVGADGLFIETHPDLQNALSDQSTMLNLNLLEPLCKELMRL